MTGRLRIVQDEAGVEIRVEHQGSVYTQRFNLRESAFACLVSNGYMSLATGSAEAQAAFSAVGTEITTSAKLLLQQGYIREV